MRKYRMSQKMPEKWFHIKLGEFLTELRERNKSNNHNVGSVLSVTNKSGFVISEEFFQRKVFSKDLTNYKIVRKGQFAYNPSRVNVGSIARLKKIDSGLLSPMYFVFETKNGLDGTYLDHWISSRRFRNLVKANTQGTVRDSLNFSALAGFPFILPPLPEQRKIADILSSIDTFIEKTQVVINQTQTLKKALMQELFTRGIPGRHKKFKKTELGRIPEEWRQCILGEHSKILSGGTPITKVEKYWEGKIPWITSADILGMHEIYQKRFITKEAIEESATNLIPKDSIIVVTRVGLGKVAINRFDLCISQDSQGVIPDRKIFCLEYLAYYLGIAAQRFITRNQGTAIKGVLKQDLLSLIVSLPSFEEQNSIADILVSFDSRIELEVKRLKEIVNFKFALMQILLNKKVKIQ